MGKCSDCGEEVERKKRWQHMMDKHPQKYETIKANAAAKRRARRDSKASNVSSTTDTSGKAADSAGKATEKTPKPPPTAELAPGEVFHVTPKAFTTTSTLFWQAWEIAVNKWGWPKDMSPQKFLDNVLYYYCYRRGFVIGGYSKVEPEPDGHKAYSEEEVKQAVEAAMSKLRGG